MLSCSGFRYNLGLFFFSHPEITLSPATCLSFTLLFFFRQMKRCINGWRVRPCLWRSLQKEQTAPSSVVCFERWHCDHFELKPCNMDVLALFHRTVCWTAWLGKLTKNHTVNVVSTSAAVSGSGYPSRPGATRAEPGRTGGATNEFKSSSLESSTIQNGFPSSHYIGYNITELNWLPT